MNVLHLSPELKWSKIFILPIARLQSSKGHNVFISTPHDMPQPILKFDNSVEFLNLISKLKKPKAHIIGLYNLIIEIKNRKINKVYLHTSIDSFLPIIFIRIFTKAQVIYVNHGVPYEGYRGLNRLLFKAIEFSNIAFSHRVISISKSMTLLLENVNLFHKEIDTLEPGTIAGIDIKFDNYNSLMKARQEVTSNLNNKTLKIIYVARIEKRKGIYELIEAVNSLKNEDLHLSILGSGIHNLKDLELDSNIISTKGYIDNISNVYLEADILIVPSYHEGFGQVYLEAATLGVIPVCSNIIGPTDFIKNGYNGFTVTPKSSESIITLIDDILKDKYDLAQIRLNAFNSAQKFDSRLVLQKNIKIFNK